MEARLTRLDADVLVSRLEFQFKSGAARTSEGRRLILESLRALAETEPSHAVGPISRHLTEVGNRDLVAALEAVSDAAQRLPAGARPSPELKKAVEVLWSRHRGRAAQPGVLSRTVELLVLCGDPIDRRLDDVELHPLAHQVLYLLALRPLAFLSEAQRNDCYRRAIRALQARGQTVGLEKLAEILGKKYDELENA